MRPRTPGPMRVLRAGSVGPAGMVPRAGTDHHLDGEMTS